MNYKDGSGELPIDWRFFFASACSGYGSFYLDFAGNLGFACFDPREMLSKSVLQALGEYGRKGKKGNPSNPCIITIDLQTNKDEDNGVIFPSGLTDSQIQQLKDGIKNYFGNYYIDVIFASGGDVVARI